MQTNISCTVWTLPTHWLPFSQYMGAVNTWFVSLHKMYICLSPLITFMKLILNSNAAEVYVYVSINTARTRFSILTRQWCNGSSWVDSCRWMLSAILGLVLGAAQFVLSWLSRLLCSGAPLSYPPSLKCLEHFSYQFAVRRLGHDPDCFAEPNCRAHQPSV